jgi:fructan beta-fructosidase
LITCNLAKGFGQNIGKMPKVDSKYFSEQHRPQFHFSPEEKWMNDPNGLVYLEGEYHLFFQYYPNDIVWGPMHWGHTVSKDLVHWEHLPIGLYPDSLGYVFSGSIVVDQNNTSGFGNGKSPPMIAIFTIAVEDKKGIPQKQGIAYSLDKGRTWIRYANNPVIDEGLFAFRDPKVFWHSPSEKWVMSVVASSDNEHIIPDHVRFYISDNLKSWQQTGEFGYIYGARGAKWECPDLIEMTVGDSGEKKWILIVSIENYAPNGGSGTQYFVGDFDGKTFTVDRPEDYYNKALWLDYGRDNYAGGTWVNVPGYKHYLIGWMSNWKYAEQVPTEKWRSAMTITRELTLKDTDNGPRVFVTPFVGIEILRTVKKDLPKQLKGALDISDIFGNSTCELEIELDISQISSDFKCGVLLSNNRGEEVEIFYNATDNKFYIDRTNSGKVDFSSKFPSLDTAPRQSTDSILKMRLFVDVASVELFTDNGAIVMTENFFPNEDFTQLKIFSNKPVKIVSGAAYELKSIWNKV